MTLKLLTTMRFHVRKTPDGLYHRTEFHCRAPGPAPRSHSGVIRGVEKAIG